MNTEELLSKLRQQLDDKNAPHLWANWELIDDYANQSLRRMFLYVRKMVIDSSTASDASGIPLCSLPIVAGTAEYAISPKIIRTTRFKLASQQRPLALKTVAELDNEHPGWQSLAAGTPWACCIDFETDTVLLVPTPATNDTASISVSRFPLARITLTSHAELPFREEYHDALIPGIKALAYAKPDSETKNGELAALEDARFLKRLDEIKEELQRRTATTHTNVPRKAFRSR